jgi:hypothetical protein
MSRLPRQLLDSNSGGDFLQGAKALARDVTGVNEARGSIVLGPKSVAQGIAAPGGHAFHPHGTSISEDSGSGSAAAWPEKYKGNDRKPFPAWKGLQAL